jgi:hypothetical protein
MLAHDQQSWLLVKFTSRRAIAGMLWISLSASSSSCFMMPDYHQPGGFSSTYYKSLQFHQHTAMAAPGHATVVPGTPPPGMHLPVEAPSGGQSQTGTLPQDGMVDPSIAQSPHYGATPHSGYNFGFSWPDFTPPQPPAGHDAAARQKSYLQFNQPSQNSDSSASSKRKKS